MADSKSVARMDYWRDYFRSANSGIFEIIERAIMVAASDCPKEFRVRRDGIAQTLFSCKLIKCSGCDKVELALPGDDDGVKPKSLLVDVDGNGSKGSCKVDDDDDDHHVNIDANNIQVSNYSYGDAEALTDEIEEEQQMFGEVLRIKEILDNNQDESESVLYNSLRKLQLMALSVKTLKESEIGKSVYAIRKHPSKDVAQIARTLIKVWKEMVDEYMSAPTEMAVAEATPESVNPSVLDEEEGLPSPPLDDLEFLNTTSLDLSQFFDGLDDYGNLSNNGEVKKNHENGRKPSMEKQNVAKLKQKKPVNVPTMVQKEESLKKQSPVLKQTRPPVADSESRRLVKLNSERKLQNSEKVTVPKRPMAPQRSKPNTSNDANDQDKLEATKRKLQERYQQAENAKRQRTIQVMELHDLPKQVSAPKSQSQHMRPINNHNRPPRR